jgi:hypothetical protein
MDSQQPNRSSSPFEYFLYTAIILETALAAVVYKVIFRNPELARMSAYFAIFYFAFLAWAIAQLNMLHRDRNPKSAPPPPQEAGPIQPEVAHDDSSRVFGITAPQLVIVVVVFATAVATFSWALRLLR